MRDSHLTVSVFRRCVGRHFVAGLAFSAALAALADGNSVAPPAPVALVRTVADAVLRDTPKPPDFDWGEGVLLSGMIEAHRLTRDPRYLDFVRRFAEHWSQLGIGPLLSAKGYCGHWGPAFAMLELSDLTGQPKPLALADEVVEFILHRATRTRDGGLDHFAGEWLATDHPLTAMPNVVLTPHIGGATWNTEARQAQMVADDLEALLNGNTPAHIVNPEVLGP